MTAGRLDLTIEQGATFRRTITLKDGADAFTGSVGIMSFDVHIHLNTLGSQEQYVKGT